MGLNSFLDGVCRAHGRRFFLAVGPFRKIWMSVSASTPFIGAGENNFSHILSNRSQAVVSRCESECPGLVHWLSCCDPDAVPLRGTGLYQFATDCGLRKEESWVWKAGCADKKIGGKRIASCRHRSEQQPHLLSA
ncbi:MAG: hypothetical protein ABR976_19475 [Terracidiphilus sp.]|jgi:hypothetical protein